MNYEKANELLQGRNKEQRKLENNTYLVRHEDSLAVRLHETDVVTYLPNGKVILNSGGWKTVTTKDRLNKYSPVRIYQEKSIWFYNDSQTDPIQWQPINRKPYFDGITFKDGVCINPMKTDPTKKTRALLKSINEYCKGINNLDVLPLPNGGDCWLCSMFESSGKARSDNEHILSHLKERYIHGSLILNALKWRGYKEPRFIWQLENERKGHRTSTVHAVRAYLKRQLAIG